MTDYIFGPLDKIDARHKALNAARDDIKTDCENEGGWRTTSPNADLVLERAQRYYEFLIGEYADPATDRAENEHYVISESPIGGA